MYAEEVVFKFQKSISIMKMISKLKDLIDLRPDMYIYACTSQGPTFLQHLKLFCPSIQFREPVGDVKPIARPYPINWKNVAFTKKLKLRKIKNFIVFTRVVPK